jgi:hypothetical protein
MDGRGTQTGVSPMRQPFRHSDAYVYLVADEKGYQVVFRQIIGPRPRRFQQHSPIRLKIATPRSLLEVLGSAVELIVAAERLPQLY